LTEEKKECVKQVVRKEYTGNEIEIKPRPEGILPCYRNECIFRMKKYYCDKCCMINDELVGKDDSVLLQNNENGV